MASSRNIWLAAAPDVTLGTNVSTAMVTISCDETVENRAPPTSNRMLGVGVTLILELNGLDTVDVLARSLVVIKFEA